jgi:CDP-4-dehydro-6-deoxyglucose reductase, E1
MQAAVGLAQMDHLEGFIADRRRNFDTLKTGLKHLEAFFILPEATPGTAPSWFGFPLTVRDDAPFTRDLLAAELNGRKIGTRLLFGGNLVRQPYMKGRNFRVAGSLANADVVVDRTLWIGVYPGLGTAEIDYVIDTFDTFCRVSQRSSLKRRAP